MNDTKAIPKHYVPKQVEEKWYSYWEKHGFFYSDVNWNQKRYTVVMPPPNVTGVLHMGHMLNNTIQDVLVRFHRMRGYNACWVPGTDHASIATEAKVVAMLQEKGIDKWQLSREAFLQYAWEWTEKYGGIILKQLRRLGVSCDWRRTKFTMEPRLYDSVIYVFCELYRRGLIYRGKRMIHWDPVGKTALSDEEVIYKETAGKLYYLRYYAAEHPESYLLIATTRPETILADTAIAIHPEDDRYQHWIGKKVLVPIVNRPVPVIADTYVDREFGTGVLKVTPGHDPNDYEIGLRHQLPILEILDESGRLKTTHLEKEANPFDGMDRFEARTAIVQVLQERGLLEKTEAITHQVGYSERTDAVVEPRLSEQWFLKMKPLAEQALQAVLEPEKEGIRLIPERFINTYRHWMENIKDWCISRQLWWGHRIPAYYLPDGQIVVAETLEKAYEEAKRLGFNGDISELKQDEDVLDTWFSSWLWPLSVFDGILDPDNEEFRYYYPTDDLVTAPEILFFWVARMIMAGYAFAGKAPFRNVYLHGIVRDKKRRKMSKSLGNSPDPIDLMDQYGADGVRMGILLASPAGNDLLFDEKLCEQGQHFCNKLWNATRLLLLLKDTMQPNAEITPNQSLAMEWMANRIHQGYETYLHLIQTYRFSECLKFLYSLIWDDFCSWYLELIKPEKDLPIASQVWNTSCIFMEQLVTMLHPFMPFVTEEIWQHLRPRKPGDSIMIQRLPDTTSPYDPSILKAMEEVRTIVRKLRAFEQMISLSKNQHYDLVMNKDQSTFWYRYGSILLSFTGARQILEANPDDTDFLPFLAETKSIAIKVASLPVNWKQYEEKLRKELEYQEGYLAIVEKKLNDPQFVQNAPIHVVNEEQQKREAILRRIEELKESLTNLKIDHDKT
jgi:valyl-tRNA synthetase